MSADEEFPMDYDHWKVLWREWWARNSGQLVQMRHTDPNPFRGKNMLADEILVYLVHEGEPLELSVGRMPAFGERPRRDLRFIGISPADAVEQPVVFSFADLERQLGLVRS